MGKVYDRLNAHLEEFIRDQHMFFVATAPLDAGGHVNVSPKGLDTFEVLDGQTVAYLDFIGSGVETVAHLRENGRIVILFCAFEGPPKIVRLHGQGDVIEPHHPEFEALAARFPDYAAVRSVIRVRCDRISDSCGFGVPLHEYQDERTQLPDWAERQGEDGLRDFEEKHSRQSVDGLPGLQKLEPKTENPA